jgi:hypothetical protein
MTTHAAEMQFVLASTGISTRCDARDDFEAAVEGGTGVDGEEDGEVFDAFDVCVGCAVYVGREAAGVGGVCSLLFFVQVFISHAVLFSCRYFHPPPRGEKMSGYWGKHTLLFEQEHVFARQLA